MALKLLWIILRKIFEEFQTKNLLRKAGVIPANLWMIRPCGLTNCPKASQTESLRKPTSQLANGFCCLKNIYRVSKS